MLKTEHHIQPYKAVGDIVFNRTRSENRQQFEIKPKTPAVVEGGMPGDEYEELGIYVMYDKYNRCAGAEFFRPARVFFEGKNLLHHSYNELFDFFKTLDPNLVEGPIEFTSYKYGISVFDPDHWEKPTHACEWIAVFRENYFNRKIGVADPEIFSTFMIQPGFVEGIEKENKAYHTLTDAFADIFRRNKEFMVMSWNSFPIRFDYKSDVPALITPWIEMLSKLSNENLGNHSVLLKSDNFEATWYLSWDFNRVIISASWNKIPGNYETVLNQFDSVKMHRSEFLYEWKILLQQCLQAFKDSGCTLTQQDDNALIKKLEAVEKRIESGGRFYRTETLELHY